MTGPEYAKACPDSMVGYFPDLVFENYWHLDQGVRVAARLSRRADLPQAVTLESLPRLSANPARSVPGARPEQAVSPTGSHQQRARRISLSASLRSCGRRGMRHKRSRAAIAPFLFPNRGSGGFLSGPPDHPALGGQKPAGVRDRPGVDG